MDESSCPTFWNWIHWTHDEAFLGTTCPACTSCVQNTIDQLNSCTCIGPDRFHMQKCESLFVLKPCTQKAAFEDKNTYYYTDKLLWASSIRDACPDAMLLSAKQSRNSQRQKVLQQIWILKRRQATSLARKRQCQCQFTAKMQLY